MPAFGMAANKLLAVKPFFGAPARRYAGMRACLSLLLKMRYCGFAAQSRGCQ